MTVSTASTHNASQSLASSRHQVGANPQRTSSSVSQVVEGGSAAPASAWQSIEATAVPSRDRGSPQHASTADASSRHRKGVEDQGIDCRTSTRRHRGVDSSTSGFGEGPTASSCATCGPPNQSHRGFHRMSQEAVGSTRCRHQRGSGGLAESRIEETSRSREVGGGRRTSPTPQAGSRGPLRFPVLSQIWNNWWHSCSRSEMVWWIN